MASTHPGLSQLRLLKALATWAIAWVLNLKILPTQGQGIYGTFRGAPFYLRLGSGVSYWACSCRTNWAKEKENKKKGLSKQGAPKPASLLLASQSNHPRILFETKPNLSEARFNLVRQLVVLPEGPLRLRSSCLSMSMQVDGSQVVDLFSSGDIFCLRHFVRCP